ncbi:MAG: urease accessory protein UreE [Candidatus Korobacteraceae bacterium]
MIISSIVSHAVHQDFSNKEADTLALTSEQRRWLRGRFTTTKGREIALALPTGSKLHPGAILLVEPDWYLAVEAAPENLLRISPRDWPHAVSIAFEVGNRHFPVALAGDKLLVPDDPAMVQLLDRIGAAWERCCQVFQPIGDAHRHDH